MGEEKSKTKKPGLAIFLILFCVLTILFCLTLENQDLISDIKREVSNNRRYRNY